MAASTNLCMGGHLAPQLFLLGAQKAGTTLLASTFAQAPGVEHFAAWRGALAVGDRRTGARTCAGAAGRTEHDPGSSRMRPELFCYYQPDPKRQFLGNPTLLLLQ